MSYMITNDSRPSPGTIEHALGVMADALNQQYPHLTFVPQMDGSGNLPAALPEDLPKRPGKT